MSERSVQHGSFAIKRTYDASPERVFGAWADPDTKARWFGSAGDGAGEHELDFRVGGREWATGKGPNGQDYTYEARYQDIVDGERIVYTYEMHLDGARISVSVATVELSAESAGTKLTFTEQGAFLDGLDTPEVRQSGSGSFLDWLGEELARTSAKR